MVPEPLIIVEVLSPSSCRHSPHLSDRSENVSEEWLVLQHA